jgi:predicted porin
LVNIRAFETPGASLFDSPLSTTNLRNRDNDSGKITYISPRFAGFQLGASFIPEYEGGGDNNSALTAPASGDLARNNGINNGAAAGLNYKNTFGGFGVQGSFGYQYGDVAADDLTGGDDDIHAWNLGAQVSYAGFSFGGAYHNATGDNGTITGGRANQINGSSWTVGAAYEFGPYTVGLGYMTGTNNRTSGVGGSTRLDQMALSGSYALGPGVKLVGALFAYDYDEEERPAVPVGVDPNTAEDGSENDGYGFVTGIKLSF